MLPSTQVVVVLGKTLFMPNNTLGHTRLNLLELAFLEDKHKKLGFNTLNNSYVNLLCASFLSQGHYPRQKMLKIPANNSASSYQTNITLKSKKLDE